MIETDWTKLIFDILGRFLSQNTKVSSISQSNMLEVEMLNVTVMEQPVWENVFQEAKTIRMSELEDYIKSMEEVSFIKAF